MKPGEVGISDTRGEDENTDAQNGISLSVKMFGISITGLGVQDFTTFDELIRGSESENLLVARLLKLVPDLSVKDAQKILNDNITEEELDIFMPLVTEMYPESRERRYQNWGGFCDMLGVGKDRLNDRMKRQ